MNNKISTVATAIADKLIELNGLPKKDLGTYSYPDGCFQFRVLDHQNENRKDPLKDVFYIGISNNYGSFNNDPFKFNESLVAGAFINEQIKSLLGNSYKINYENNVTQVFGDKEKNPSAILNELAYQVGSISDKKISKKLDKIEVKEFYLSAAILRTQDFHTAASAPETGHITLIYNTCPALKEAAVSAITTSCGNLR